MPRPCKKRRICAKPSCIRFGPQGSGPDAGTVTMTLEEYESIRLMDYEGLTQEQAARQMDAARTTVQGIYSSARRKIAQCLVNGHMLHLEGGNFVLCEETGKCCHRHCCNKKEKKREGMDMRIGVTYENGQIYQHFGHTEQFKVYDVQDNKVVSSTVIDTNGSGHGALAGFLLDNKVDTLICGGIGGGAQAALSQAGIRLYGGVSGSADEAVNTLLAGTLSFDPAVRCDHHDHKHGGEAHACGDHGCGHHSCG